MNGLSRVSSRPSSVRERLIGALIPDARNANEDGAAMPLPALPALRLLDRLEPTALRVSTTRMDHSGRVHERILLRELGWEPGRRLEMDTMHGMILIAAEPSGRHQVDRRGAIVLPAPLRRLCRIDRGPPLVLAAAIPEQVMVVHPAATVARLLATHYTDLIRVNGHSHNGEPPADDTPRDRDNIPGDKWTDDRTTP